MENQTHALLKDQLRAATFVHENKEAGQTTTDSRVIRRGGGREKKAIYPRQEAIIDLPSTSRQKVEFSS